MLATVTIGRLEYEDLLKSQEMMARTWTALRAVSNRAKSLGLDKNAACEAVAVVVQALAEDLTREYSEKRASTIVVGV